MRQMLAENGMSPEESRLAFLQFDSDRDGVIDVSEFRSFVTRVLGLKLRTPELSALWRMLDTDNTGAIGFQEFAAIIFPHVEIEHDDEVAPQNQKPHAPPKPHASPSLDQKPCSGVVPMAATVTPSATPAMARFAPEVAPTASGSVGVGGSPPRKGWAAPSPRAADGSASFLPCSTNLGSFSYARRGSGCYSSGLTCGLGASPLGGSPTSFNSSALPVTKLSALTNDMRTLRAAVASSDERLARIEALLETLNAQLPVPDDRATPPTSAAPAARPCCQKARPRHRKVVRADTNGGTAATALDGVSEGLPHRGAETHEARLRGSVPGNTKSDSFNEANRIDAANVVLKSAPPRRTVLGPGPTGEDAADNGAARRPSGDGARGAREALDA